MKNKIIITTIALFSLALHSCSDQDSIIDGKANACILKHLRESLDKDPSNAVLQDSVNTYEMFVKINRENYGDHDAFNKAIDEHLKSCD